MAFVLIICKRNLPWLSLSYGFVGGRFKEIIPECLPCFPNAATELLTRKGPSDDQTCLFHDYCFPFLILFSHITATPVFFK